MTTYKRFEDLPVWQKAADIAANMFTWTMHSGFGSKGDLANQMQRATLSISNNIAEGFERGSTNELLYYLYIARGSAGEVRSMLCVMERMKAFYDLAFEIAALKEECESISRQLHGWATSLQNSNIDGVRHLNDQSRERYFRRERQKSFYAEQEQFRKELEERLKRKAKKDSQESDN